jgi:hypothetical protein
MPLSCRLATWVPALSFGAISGVDAVRPVLDGAAASNR